MTNNLLAGDIPIALSKMLNTEIPNIKFSAFSFEREKYFPLQNTICCITVKNINSVSALLSDFSGVNNDKTESYSRRIKITLRFSLYSAKAKECYDGLNNILNSLLFSKKFYPLSICVSECEYKKDIKAFSLNFTAESYAVISKNTVINNIEQVEILPEIMKGEKV